MLEVEVIRPALSMDEAAFWNGFLGKLPDRIAMNALTGYPDWRMGAACEEYPLGGPGSSIHSGPLLHEYETFCRNLKEAWYLAGYRLKEKTCLPPEISFLRLREGMSYTQANKAIEQTWTILIPIQLAVRGGVVRVGDSRISLGENDGVFFRASAAYQDVSQVKEGTLILLKADLRA